MNRDAIHQEIYEIQKDMQGISPNLDTYKKLEKKLAELKSKLQHLRDLAKIKK